MAESLANSPVQKATRPRPRRRRSPKVQVVLDDELFLKLRTRAARDRRSVSQTVRFLIEKALALDDPR
jgi:hypothetical protein